MGGEENAARYLKYWCIIADLYDTGLHIPAEIPELSFLPSSAEFETIAFVERDPKPELLPPPLPKSKLLHTRKRAR